MPALFLSVMLFLITKTEIALTIWELLSILGAPAILIVLLKLSDLLEISRFCKNLMLVFLSCTTALTGIAHFVNITVTRPLIAQGVDVPTYFQIGYWPSVEMAVDYLAWGLFMGLAFLTAALGIGKLSNAKPIKITLIICSLLCLFGIIGTTFVNENCWYTAPLGYGLGTIVICIEMLFYEKKQV